MKSLKFWQRDPVRDPLAGLAVDFEPVEVEEVEEDEKYFVLGSPLGAAAAEVAAHEKEYSARRRERILNDRPTWMGQKNLPGLPPREYKFEDRQGPLAPASALYVPRPLSEIEQTAIHLTKMMTGVTLKGDLKKKIADSERGPRRVVFDSNGKMKEVKEEAR